MRQPGTFFRPTLVLFLASTHTSSSFSATYGGHLELSAFAHMKKCNVKVIQPGLVYLIEWAAGWDPVTAAKDNSHVIVFFISHNIGRAGTHGE
jgi:hypothetical protein